MTRSGGRILVDQLALHGADLAFGVPGESYIDVLDALRDSPIRFVTCRHEAGAANMTEAYGKLTNRPGICLVVSPLIALMKDQVDNLRKRGLKAEAIYAGMSHQEIDHALDNCVYGRSVKFLYVSPERLLTELFQVRERMSARRIVPAFEGIMSHNGWCAAYHQGTGYRSSSRLAGIPSWWSVMS